MHDLLIVANAYLPKIEFFLYALHKTCDKLVGIQFYGIVSDRCPLQRQTLV